MGKGILLEMAGREAVVLTPQGEFRKVPVPLGKWDIGDEIEYAEVRQQPVWLRWGTAAAAAAVFMVGSFVGYNQYTLAQPVAVITVDINPSLELTLNKADQVLKAQALNADGELVLKGVDYKRKPVGEVLVQLTDRAVEEHKLNPADESSAVVVAVAPAAKRDLTAAQAERVVETAKAAVKNEVAKVASARGEAPKTSVAVLTATKEEKQQAEAEGLSVGKFKLWTEIHVAVPAVTIDELKELGPGKALKSHGVSPSEIFTQAEKKNEESKEKSKDDEKAKPASAPGKEQGDEKKEDPAGKPDDKEKGNGQDKKDEEKKSSGAQPSDQPGADKKDEAKKAEFKQDDAKKVESKLEQSKPEQSKQEESKQVQPKKAEPKKDEPKKAEPKNEKKDDGKKNTWTIPWLGITIEKPAFLRDKEDAQPAAASEAPAVATPRAEEPGVGAPVAGPPAVEPERAESKQNEPKREEPKTAGPKNEERKQADEQQKQADEKKAEAQKQAEEKKTEESKQDAAQKSEKETSKDQGKDSGKEKDNKENKGKGN